MRPVAALFSDTGKMILRGGWQILGVSALIWAVWTIIFALATVLLVNFESLSRALQYWSDALDRYPDGVLPESVNSEFGRLLTQVPSPLPLVGWIAVGIAACAVTLLAVTTQVVAVNKLAMDAAADRPVRFGEAMRSCLGAGTRLAGYALLLIAASAAAIALLVAGTAVTALVSPVLAAVVGTLGFLAFTVLSWWICGRLVPLVAQVVVARGSLKWSWNSTRNKWFAVVGRYLLWYIVAGAVTSIVVMIVVIPLAMAAGISAAAGAGPVGGLLLMIIMYAVMIPIDFALSGVLSAGAVPIWRDLTDDPRYATIQPTARPV
ncbi:MAG: hypothetical protein U0990_06555 [Candidatus Nanopelagicales bacterium]|nr:hypothetical protein [Candidatus Nanopelagicales bacterium]MDZ4249736.1 hypothetical protein [Candidatus Nanopelagicales bacterium]